MQSITEQFKAWVKTRQADEAYAYACNGSCAFAQFLTATGYALAPSVYPCGWREKMGSERHTFSVELEQALVTRPHTFGELAKRLEKVQL